MAVFGTARLAAFVFAMGALGCAGPRLPHTLVPEVPAAEDDEPLLSEALDELRLPRAVVDAGARCSKRAASARAPSAAACELAPPELELDAPELRDPRHEPAFDLLWTPQRYEKAIARLEDALVRTQPHTRARQKILGWLVNAHDRLRQTKNEFDGANATSQKSMASPCLEHYLGLLASETAAGKDGLVRYTLALELEHAGDRDEALRRYESLLGEPARGAALSAAHLALGDAEFRASFCDPTRLSAASLHYLVAAYGRAPSGVPLTAFARVRLAQVDERLGAFGPALHELELAELGGIDRGIADYSGPRMQRRRALLEHTLHALAARSLRERTLRLLLALQPPNSSMCMELGRLGQSSHEPAVLDQIRFAMSGPCNWNEDAEQECVTKAGCSVGLPKR